jgi:hypothetical protein
MKGSLILSWGEYGGFYYRKGKATTRLCLGRIAITYMPEDIDDVFKRLSQR